MTVTLTSEALGKKVGDTYTGPEEAWLLAHGYASKANYGDDTAAVLTGGSDAATIVTGGALVLRVNGVSVSTTLADADTAAAAATKIDTALSGVADAAITSSKLAVTTVKTGEAAEIVVVSGGGTVLANLGLTVGQRANGTGGGIGTANTGQADVLPANDLTLNTNREPGPKYDNATGYYDAGQPDPAMNPATDPGAPYPPKDPSYDFDAGDVNDDAPSDFVVSPLTGLAQGGELVTISGQNFTGATGVTFGGNAATSVTVVDDETITCKVPAHAAGAVSVVVTNPTGSKTEATAFTYTAPKALTVTPATGDAAGGTAVVITGEGFKGATDATSVTFGGTAGTAFSVVDDGTIHVTSPAKTAGTYDVVVVSASGNQTKTGGFVTT